MLAAAVPITRTLHVINLCLTSSISGFSRQSLNVHASSTSGLRRRPLAVLDHGQSLVARRQSPVACHQPLAVRHRSLNP